MYWFNRRQWKKLCYPELCRTHFLGQACLLPSISKKILQWLAPNSRSILTLKSKNCWLKFMRISFKIYVLKSKSCKVAAKVQPVFPKKQSALLFCNLSYPVGSSASASAKLISNMFSGPSCSCWFAMWRQQRLALFATLILLQVKFFTSNSAFSNFKLDYRRAPLQSLQDLNARVIQSHAKVSMTPHRLLNL
jgi:hypothetical protein